MGYFSQYAVESEPQNDRSYPSEQMLLKLRHQELTERKEELELMGHISSEFLLSVDDIKYILPEHLTNARDVDIAIEIVERRLFFEYGIDIDKKYEPICSDVDDNGQDIFITDIDKDLMLVA